jgi:glycosyltransferase involved in cell wall biosynthesis
MNNYDLMERNDQNKEAMGGSELMLSRIYDGSVPRELLEKFQIISSRVRELNPNKVRILILNDLPEDPESAHLANGGWKKFHRLVFVSNWQAQRYIEKYQIPPSRTIVMKNAIVPIEDHEKPTDKIRLAYWSTPHRGLDILVPVFEKLTEKYDNIELHTFASFKLYGWEDRDQPFKELFEKMDNNPNIFRHETATNEELREELKNYHILAYPNTWQESSCLVLIEAQSAGLACVHPNLAALPETSGSLSLMYQYIETKEEHAKLFYSILDQTIENYWNPYIQEKLKIQKFYCDIVHNWNDRSREWTQLLNSFKDSDTKLPVEEKAMFSYTVG